MGKDKISRESMRPHRMERTRGFWAWQVLIWCIQSITPLSYLWLMRIMLMPRGTFGLMAALFSTWTMLEAAYLPYFWLARRRLSQRGTALHACASQNERTELLAKCLAASALASAGMDPRAAGEAHAFEVYREWFLRWFHVVAAPGVVRLTDLRRGNLEEWLAWAFFDSTLQDIEQDLERRTDCSHLADLLEEALHTRFAQGYNAEIASIRLTLDPVFATQRPLVYYAAINLLLALGKAGIYLLGYRPRIINGLRLYHRPAISRGTTPIVFCHGLGIGYLHYMMLLRKLPRDRDIYLLDFPNITMTLGAEKQASIIETQQLLQRVLQQDGHQSACFVAHSFGTIVVSWLLNSSDPEVRALVKSAVLIDPISLLLFDPAVAANFVHRRPRNSVEMMMSYFVSQELYIAHTLARLFSWSDAVLFLQDVPCHVRVEVILSGADAIVPAAAVRAYIRQSAVTAVHQPTATTHRNTPQHTATHVSSFWM